MTELIEHSEADWEDWRYEVANGDTRLGIDDWIVHRREAAVWDPDNTDLVSLPRTLLLSLLEPLRLAHVYALKDSHPEELGDDFKPHKWDGYEIEFARSSSDAYRRLIEGMLAEQEAKENSSPRS